MEEANRPACGFPLQNLAYCSFEAGSETHLGVGIGGSVLDLFLLSKGGHLDDVDGATRQACLAATLNPLMACGPSSWAALRAALTRMLREGAPEQLQRSLAELLVPMAGMDFTLPVAVANYTDFYASLDHATNVGRLFRPDQPLLPNYKHVPIAYHGRASSLVQSGTGLHRPHGQVRVSPDAAPMYRPTLQLDYELEVGAYVGTGNALGAPIPIGEAETHIFGFSLLNDFSARDVQAWEYQPLGPFLGKNFGTTLGPWVVPAEALAPYRTAARVRAQGDPTPLPYLDNSMNKASARIDMTVEVYLSTAAMRVVATPPVRLSSSRLADLYWSFGQMVTHHTANGCNLLAGDLLGSGTISGATQGSEGCLLELTRRGTMPVALGNGESRTFLEDGDEVILRGYCEREGLPRISLGECCGIILPPVRLS